MNAYDGCLSDQNDSTRARHADVGQKKQKLNRSLAACEHCRAQKMKCDGPEAGPCRRCKRANVECVFGETQGKARQVIWSKTVLNIDAKVKAVEDTFLRQESSILALEKDLQRFRDEAKAASTLWGCPPQKWSTPFRAAKSSRRPLDILNYKNMPWSRYQELHAIFKTQVEPRFGWVPLAGSADILRETSPLWTSVVCMAGARAIQAHHDYEVLRKQAVMYVPDVVAFRTFDHRANRMNCHTVMGLIAFVMHVGFVIAPAYVVDAAECFQLPTVISFLSDRIMRRAHHEREQLIAVARAYLTTWFFAVYYGTAIGTPCIMRLSQRKQVLEWFVHFFATSDVATTEWDLELPVYIEYFTILEEAQFALATFSQIGMMPTSIRLKSITDFGDRLRMWHHNITHSSRHQVRSSIRKAEFTTLFHRGMTIIVFFALSRDGPAIQANPDHLSIAQVGVRHALAIINEFLAADDRNEQLTVTLDCSRFTFGLAISLLVGFGRTIPTQIPLDDVLCALRDFATVLEMGLPNIPNPSKAAEYFGEIWKYFELLTTIKRDEKGNYIEEIEELEADVAGVCEKPRSSDSISVSAVCTPSVTHGADQVTASFPNMMNSTEFNYCLTSMNDDDFRVPSLMSVTDRPDDAMFRV